ncbi:hypothetical protein VCR4J5_1510002 [Vibrio crassostreae]|uniref:Uncharacterized protein n=1 Tax=Vibrio crassostreae TaxID=246167 RepID=A0ABM9QPC9_9VIBR|nr:transposase [Vibrio crassostreae]CDT03372.1 hypothetical protein VCR19J5_1210342 [Vibrio crassostreae]CDT10765.1 hypothetical protein VCR4J5_1510002 [Vibrio crassostreae]CDT67555.1 hypothetical protein VCR20J5_740166 [Vibrio crassostreae]
MMKLGFAQECAIDQLNLLKQVLLRMQALGSILEALGPSYGEIHSFKLQNTRLQKRVNQKG